MDKEAIREFAGRDWTELERLKEAYWREELGAGPSSRAYRLGVELRQRVSAQQPDWPGPAERQADLDSHVALAGLIQRVDGKRHCP